MIILQVTFLIGDRFAQKASKDSVVSFHQGNCRAFVLDASVIDERIPSLLVRIIYDCCGEVFIHD